MTHSHGAPGTICVLTNSKIIGSDVADAAREKIGVFMKMRGGMPYFRLPQSGSRMKSQLLSSVLCALSAHLSSSQVSSLSSYSTVRTAVLYTVPGSQKTILVPEHFNDDRCCMMRLVWACLLPAALAGSRAAPAGSGIRDPPLHRSQRLAPKTPLQRQRCART
eukprot:COSAG02_NODE_6870_length_3315_cov_1.293843_1_plen_163_part_00